MKVSDLAKKEKELVIRVGDGPTDLVHVVYRPGALTLEVSDQVKEIMETGFEHEVALAMLKAMVVKWDLEDEDEKELPVNEQTIKQVPLEFLGMILRGIEADARPNPTMGETSDGTSPQTERPEQPPTGISSSEQQIDSSANRGSSLVSQ